MQLPIGVWRHMFTYLTLNDLIEISCVCNDFYHLCANNRFYVKKINQSKRIFRERSWLPCRYKQLCENFYYSLFRKLMTYVLILIDNLIPARKIIHHTLYSSLLPLRVWIHLFQCCRPQYESNMCLFCKNFIQQIGKFVMLLKKINC